MAAPELKFAEVAGLSVGYRQAGEGTPLVLLHGFLCDSRCWMAQLSGMADRFAVVAWDAPGAGGSSDPPETFTTADYARCLASFLDTIGVGTAHVVGLSWGGILAQELYRLYPERLRRLVLADTYAGWKGSPPEPVWTPESSFPPSACRRWCSGARTIAGVHSTSPNNCMPRFRGPSWRSFRTPVT
jgi:pimeloyl-ACP methyl ester carboxylesterase